MSRRCTALVLLLSLMFILPECGQKELSEPAKLEKIESLYQKYKRSFPDTPELTVEELVALQAEEEVVLVDVRESREREVSIIPGAISADEFERDIDRYRDSTIVSYCTIGSRSGMYAQELRAKGVRAFNLKGSILSWLHAGQKVVNREGETRRVHVYGRQWNLVPRDYEAVW